VRTLASIFRNVVHSEMEQAFPLGFYLYSASKYLHSAEFTSAPFVLSATCKPWCKHVFEFIHISEGLRTIGKLLSVASACLGTLKRDSAVTW
jgi:hypothetical protein